MKYDSKTALLAGTIDYAGTFAPASLPLGKAIAKAARWPREGVHPWLYNKMALPISDIAKLNSKFLLENGSEGLPWLFTALGSPLKEADPVEFYKLIEWDLREIQRCHERWYYSTNRQEIISYETKLPPSVTEMDVSSVSDFFSSSLERAARSIGNQIQDFFLEVSLEGDWERAIQNTCVALTEWREDHDDLALVPGIKIRTGGTLIPTPGQLSTVISLTAENGLRFKATQGLHSALSHDRDFGFVNLFAAINFAYAYGTEKFGADKIEKCLVETDSKQFQFEAEHFKWLEYQLSLDEIEGSRRIHGATFGSCSLDEPDQSLTKEYP